MFIIFLSQSGLLWLFSNNIFKEVYDDEKWKQSFSFVRLFVTLWTVAHQAPLSMEFSRQEYWSGLPCPSPGDLPNIGIEPGFPTLQVDSLLTEPPGCVFVNAYVILFFLAIYYSFLLIHAYMSSNVTLSIDNYIKLCSLKKKKTRFRSRLCCHKLCPCCLAQM